MRIRKGTLKRIIKEEYRRLVRQGLISEAKADNEGAYRAQSAVVEWAEQNGYDPNKVGIADRGDGSYDIDIGDKTVLRVKADGTMVTGTNKIAKWWKQNNIAKKIGAEDNVGEYK